MAIRKGKKTAAKAKAKARPKAKAKPKKQISHTKIDQVLGKAIVNKEFRAKLFKDPAGVGKRLGLNESGIEVIRKMDKKKFREFIKKLDAKLLKDAAAIIFCASY